VGGRQRTWRQLSSVVAVIAQQNLPAPRCVADLAISEAPIVPRTNVPCTEATPCAMLIDHLAAHLNFAFRVYRSS
jgi:hypothetical protein